MCTVLACFCMSLRAELVFLARTRHGNTRCLACAAKPRPEISLLDKLADFRHGQAEGERGWARISSADNGCEVMSYTKKRPSERGLSVVEMRGWATVAIVENGCMEGVNGQVDLKYVTLPLDDEVFVYRPIPPPRGSQEA